MLASQCLAQRPVCIFLCLCASLFCLVCLPRTRPRIAPYLTRRTHLNPPPPSPAPPVADDKPKISIADYALVVFYVAIWYVGNILYIKYNDEAKVAFAVPTYHCPAGKKCKSDKDLVRGKDDVSAWAMSVATAQLFVGVLYAAYLWLAPDTRKMPKVAVADLLKMTPTGACSALAHASSVFALSVGGIAFGSIVKAAEPVFSAVVSTFVYKKPPSVAKFLCFIPIVGGIAIASLKFKDNFSFGNLDTVTPVIDKDFFSVPGLLFACAANVFAAFKGTEGSKVKNDKELQSKLQGEANSFAVFGIISLLVSIPLMIFKEVSNPGGFGALWEIIKTKPNAARSLLLSGFTFYVYNECAFMTQKSASNPAGMDPVLNSVANTAKRVVVIYYGALLNGKVLTTAQIVGCSVCIVGVFLYSVIDDVVKSFGAKAKTA